MTAVAVADRRAVVRPSGAAMDAMDLAYLHVRLSHQAVADGLRDRAAAQLRLAQQYTARADALIRGAR